MTGHSLKECFCVQEGVMLAWTRVAVLKRDILDSRYILEVVFTGPENGLHVGVADRMGGGESATGGGFWNKGLDGTVFKMRKTGCVGGKNTRIRNQMPNKYLVETSRDRKLDR